MRLIDAPVHKYFEAFIAKSKSASGALYVRLSCIYITAARAE